MKKIAIITAGAAVAGSLMLAAPASADGCLSCYIDNPGRQQATEVGAQNGTGAGSGSFGYFGNHDGTNTNLKGGADGTQTGINNSSVSGNRAGPGTQPTPRHNNANP